MSLEKKSQEERVPNMERLRSRFPVGTRVRTRRDVERFPHFTVPAGSTGVVIDAIPEAVTVKMDRHVPGCEEWDNAVVWVVEDLLYSDLGDDLEVIAPHKQALDDIDYAAHMSGEPTDSWTLIIEPDPNDPGDDFYVTVECDSRQQAEQCIRIIQSEGGVVHVSLNELSGAALIADHVEAAESAAGWDPTP